MLAGFFKVQPIETRGGALRAYVPLVLWNRGLALVRLLVVAMILGATGKPEFARYQIALAFINWIVPVVMLGVDSIVERYAAQHQRAGNLAAFLGGHFRRLLLGTALLLALVAVASAPLGQWLFAHAVPVDQGRWLLVLAALDIALVAGYQWVAATLRGLRAYQASAGLETLAATLLLVFSCAGAWMDGAAALLLAYGASTLLPLLWYGAQLRRFARAQSAAPAPQPMERLGWFGIWSQVRLILWMTTPLVALRGVELLAGGAATTSQQTADYALAWSVAQLLMYLAVTLWSSTYAMAASKHSLAAPRMASYQFVQMGKLGGLVLLAGGAAIVMGGRLVVQAFLPAYLPAVGPLLPPMVGLFFWYGMIAFLVSLGDLQERPWAGATMWGCAVLLQIAALVVWKHRLGLPGGTRNMIEVVAPDAQWAAVWASVFGAAAALGIARLLLRRDVSLVPIGGLVLAGAGFFMSGLLGLLWSAAILLVLGSSGLLVRPREWRKMRKMGKVVARRAAGRKY